MGVIPAKAGIHKLTAFGGTFLTTLPIFAIITNSYTIKSKVWIPHQACS